MVERFFGNPVTTASKIGFPSLMTEGAARPAIDITEKDAAIMLTAELPGMSEEEVDLSISDGMLTLKGEKSVSHESRHDQSVVIERSYGSFQRALPIPDRVDRDANDATFGKGVLSVTMPKKPGQQSGERKVTIGG